MGHTTDHKVDISLPPLGGPHTDHSETPGDHHRPHSPSPVDHTDQLTIVKPSLTTHHRPDHRRHPQEIYPREKLRK